MLVLVPSGGTEIHAGRQLLVDGVVIDYNATLLPDNLVRNPDVDSAASDNRQSTVLLALQLASHLVRRRSAESHPFARTRRQQCDSRSGVAQLRDRRAGG